MKLLLINNGIHIKNLNAILKYNTLLDIIVSPCIYEIDLSEFDVVYSPCTPIDVKKYPNTKFIFGPHFSIFPEKNKMDIIEGNTNVVYIQPSDWAKNVWQCNDLCKNIKLETLPFGVDTENFYPIKPNLEREKVFIYFKHRNPIDLQLIETFLNIKKYDYKIFSYENRYNEKEYLEYLQNSKFGIWVGGHESQGFALEEALSCNIPLLVWSVKSMNQEYGSNYDDNPATTIPYWDERCGEYFHNSTELEDTFDKFISKLETYKPREYILENLTMEICEQKFIQLIKNI
jgi:glycosyltransferase involved in cell wall biosynthesis